MSARTARTPGLVSGLAGSTPDLTGALCRGRWDLFDPANEGEARPDVTARQLEAVALCGRCPALAECRDWIRSSPRRYRQGVVGGHVYFATTSKEQNDD